MAKLQLKNLDIGFSPRVDYDPYSFTPLKDAVQFFSTSLFILITLSLGTQDKTLWNSTCHILLPTKSDSKNAISLFLPLLLSLSLLHISPLNTMYNYSCICLLLSFPISMQDPQRQDFVFLAFSAVILPAWTVHAQSRCLHESLSLLSEKWMSG